MAVIIAHARGDERGQLRGGVAGDQTGREVCTQTWYRDARGWDILRPKDPTVAECIAQDAEWGCKNDRIGYDQGDNQSLWFEVLPCGWDCREAENPCETDCSQYVRVCASYALQRAVPYFYTGDEKTVLLSTGEFIHMTGTAYAYSQDYLRRGDIGVTRTKGHTWIAISDGPKAYVWDSSVTILAQQFYNTPVDGEIWGQYLLNKRYLPNAGSGWKFGLSAKGSALIRAMQEELAAGGYYSDRIDGLAGRNFVLGLQRMLNDLEGAQLDPDGIMGAQTVKAFLRHITR